MFENNMFRIIGALLLLTVFASQAVAFGGKAPEIERDRIMAGISKKLDLNQEQKDRFRERNEKMKENMKAHRQEMKELADRLKQELQKDDPNKAAIQGLIRQIGQKRTEMELKRMDNLFELRKILTPEQRKKFKQMLDRQKPPRGKIPPKKR